MRKALAILFISSTLSLAHAQSWMDIGIKGSFGADLLFNSNIANDQEFNQRLSSGFNVGGKLGWNFNDFHEVTIDVMYYKFNQKYKYNVLDSASQAKPEYSRSLAFSGIDFLLMYRHNNDGRYVEIGPMFSLVKNITGTDSYNGSNFTSLDFKSHLAPSFTSIVFGFGSYLIGSEQFGITTGIRLAYSFTDLIADKGVDSNFPTNNSTMTEVGGGYVLSNRDYGTYKQTHVMTAMFVMEANLDFAFMAKARCQNKRKLVLF